MYAIRSYYGVRAHRQNDRQRYAPGTERLDVKPAGCRILPLHDVRLNSGPNS